MVALAAQPILTTIGRVAVPKLADTLVRTGANKFVKQYGQKAFEAVLGTTAAKRKGTAAGKQFVKQPKSIANKVKPYRSFA